MRQRLSEWLEINVHRIAVGTLLQVGLHFVEEGHDRPATILAELASDQVERLNAIGALIDLRNSRISHELLHAVLGNVSVSTEDLLRKDRVGKTAVGEDAFDHRRE